MHDNAPADDGFGAWTVAAWRNWLLRDYDNAWRALSNLHETDQSRFLDVCRLLAADEETRVAAAGLRQLGFRGERDDAEADRVARGQLDRGDASLRDAALLALGRVGLPSAFASLEPYVTTESPVALLSYAKQARDVEQRTRVLACARKLVFARHAQVRVAAVRILRGLSTVVAEQNLLVQAASANLDEVTFSALRHADVRALPGLWELQARLRAGSEQWKDVTAAIAAIESRSAHT